MAEVNQLEYEYLSRYQYKWFTNRSPQLGEFLSVLKIVTLLNSL